MNNRQKRKYITDLLIFLSQPFLSELDTRRDFLKQTPKVLYKYNKFKKYTFEMFENNYAYLAPVKGLDDPFDCLNDFSFKSFYNEKTKKVTPKAIDYIIKNYCPNGLGEYDSKQIKDLAIKCINEDGIDPNKLPKIIKGDKDNSRIETEPLFIVLNNFNENFENLMKDIEFDGFAKSAMSPGERVGVCSLSEKRDNKVMWSLYGSGYKGYCVEYDIPMKKEVTFNLCPVIYTKRNNNRFIEKVLEHFMSSMLRAVTNGEISGNIGATMELFCTKDKDWSYQAEWRIIGIAREHFKHLNVKAVYLGFKVTKTNETKMKRIAKSKGFTLYKMKAPDGTKKIRYSKIV